MNHFLKTFDWKTLKKPPYPAAFAIYFTATLFLDAVLGISGSGGLGYLLKQLIVSAIFVCALYWLAQKGWLEWKKKQNKNTIK